MLPGLRQHRQVPSTSSSRPWLDAKFGHRHSLSCCLDGAFTVVETCKCASKTRLSFVLDVMISLMNMHGTTTKDRSKVQFLCRID